MPDGIVLIVDDDPIGRMSLETLLKDERYKILLAATGKEALAHAQEFPPDLVILDILLPDLSGYDICKILRSNKATEKSYVVMITSMDSRKAHLEAMQAGADLFINKPFNFSAMRSLVEKVITKPDDNK